MRLCLKKLHVSDLGLHCLSRLIAQATRARNISTITGDLFCALRSQNSAPFSMEFRCFFPNLLKKIPIFKKIFFEDWGFHAVNTHLHTSYMVTFSFN